MVLAVVLACLLVAFFPRTERGLFAFPGRDGGVLATISAPIQTRLRSAIFGEPAPAVRRLPAPAATPRAMVAPVFEPDLAPPLLDDPWRDSLLADNPLDLGGFDFPGLPGMPGLTDPFGPNAAKRPFNGVPVVGDDDRPGTVVAVPEPGTWAMMILGVGAIAYRLRAVRRRALKRRAHERWRRSLVPGPAPVPALAANSSPAPDRKSWMPAHRQPAASEGMALLIGSWGRATRRCDIGGFGPGANRFAHGPAASRE